MERIFLCRPTEVDERQDPAGDGGQGINWWSMAALSWATTLPLIVIALERYIIKGMASGAEK